MPQIFANNRDSDSDSESETSDNESINSYSSENGQHGTYTTDVPPPNIMHISWHPLSPSDDPLSPSSYIRNAYDKNGIEINPTKRGFLHIINGYNVWVRALYTELADGETEYSLQVLVYNRINNHYGWASARPSSTDPEILTVLTGGTRFTGGSIWKQLGEMVDMLP